ncbi:MAG TPA: prolyl oligopeptidase family serine peptidase [Planctomycetota bacterium]|nr:prolyl oligopeptidase family serine peptidase [Planctomycetota bacterium]
MRLAAAMVLLFLPPLLAQGTAADYERANGLAARWRNQVVEFRPAWHWLDGGSALWFEGRGPDGATFVRVDSDGSVRRAAKAEDLGVSAAPHRLTPGARQVPSGSSTLATSITFENHLERSVRLFWLDARGRPRAFGELAPGAARQQPTFAGHTWLADFATDDLAGIFVADEAPGIAVFDEQSRRVAMERTAQPARAVELFVREYDVWGRDAAGDEFRLSATGTASDPYHRPDNWSPDGGKVLGFQVEPGEERRVQLIEAAPKDQLQPKLHSYAYQKPGDRIDRPRPRLFDVQARREIPVADEPFENAWSVDHVQWSGDGKEVYCLYNRRGHQVLRLLAIDAASGAVRTVLEEKSETFVDYSQKTFLHWLDGTRGFLWTSERDGYNHLYRGNTATGELVQVTRGPWLVRRVEHVDEARREIWFVAYGMRGGEDPYHAHLARVEFDGGNLVRLSEGDGTHECTFSPDRSLFVDRWSRVDQPWVTELRRARDGALVAELGRDDAAPLLGRGFRPPLRFVAKGRDGTTDIHGILILPSTFDERRSYPVVEDIYAGPHDHFVPERWGLGLRQRALAELGFVVVQIDGMGTNWRSRAFHDVAWRNLADSGFPDRIAWLHEAATVHPFLDLSRVGIFGGSAGGQSALAALLHHGDFYRAAAADCGCHDNRMDKIWWNEAWMGWPIGPWYADCSNVTHAGKLQGKLLLTVGELDHNVDPASTMQVVAALIAADKDFDFVVVPGGGHGVGETSYLVRRRQDFFVRNLLGVEPRRP